MLTPVPRLDLSKITFPSDDLSFGRLRSVFPDLFDTDVKVTFFSLSESSSDYHSVQLTNLLEGEREIATMAFSEAVGQTWRDPDGFSRNEIKKFLTEDYIRYGVARGKQHAAQLIREIESEAIKQAKSNSR